MSEEQTPPDLDLPIAMRRQRRNNAVTPAPDTKPSTPDANSVKTPSKPRSKKRVRFSEPGASTSNTTGLTPFVQRTSLASSSDRRHSAPCGNVYPYPTIQTRQFTPIRQVIDERSKRRLRRNGLSTEMNNIENDRREMKKLQKEIVEKDRALEVLRNELEGAKKEAMQSESHDPERVSEIEEELRRLKASMEGHPIDTDTAIMDWEDIQHSSANAPDGIDDGATIPILEDSQPNLPASRPSYKATETINDATTSSHYSNPSIDGETLAMALDLETAKHEKRVLFKDFQQQFPSQDRTSLDFADTPSTGAASSNASLRSLRSPPPNFMHNLSRTLTATKSRAEDAELALHSLSIELKALGFPGSDPETIIEEIQSQFRTARLELERTIPGETVPGFENAALLRELIQKLKYLASRVKDREAELKSMYEQHHALKGNFDHSLMSLDKAGEKIRDLEHVVDQSAEEMLELRMKIQAMEKEVTEKDRTVNSLVSALDKYRSEVQTLEQLVTSLESSEPVKVQEAQGEIRNEMGQAISDLECKVIAEEKGRRAAESEAVSRLQKIEELERAAEQNAMDIQLQTQKMVAEKETLAAEKEDEANANAQQIGSLSTRISNLSTALENANAEIKKLKTIKTKLESRLQAEMEQAQLAVESIEAAMVKSVVKVNESKKKYIRRAKIRQANSEMADEEEDAGFSSEAGASSAPMTPVSMVRFVDVEVGRGEEGKRERRAKKRVQRDSGVGMESVEEIEEEIEEESQVEGDDSGMVLEA